jgi:PKD repeat protein
MRLFLLFLCFWAYSSFGWGQDCDASFATNLSGCNDVTFTPDNDDASLSYSWDFGDGETSTDRVPTHRYLSFGDGNQSFMVTLTVSGSDCMETSTEEVTVQQVPDVNIEDTSGDGFVKCSPSEVEIRNISSTTSTNIEYTIDWGDGSASIVTDNFNTLSHFYTSARAFTISVTVEGNNGCSNTESFTYIISVSPQVRGGLVGSGPTCVPGVAEIAIEGWENNTPNTIYTIRSNDGRDSIVINHPPPYRYFHPIDSTACGTVSNFDGAPQPESFQVSVTASTRGCPGLSRVFNAGPIRTTTIPTAGFEISPEPNVCQEELFTVMNTAQDGIFYDPTTQSCVSRTGVSWTISPNSGFQFQSGSLLDTSGFSLTFQEPGVYIIRQIVENRVFNIPSNTDPDCPADTLIKTICVLPIPDSEFTPEEASGCTNGDDPLIVDFDNNSNTLDACDPNSTYTWSVDFTAGECGSPSEPVLVDRTPLNLLDNPSFNDQDIRLRFDSAGIYTVYLTVANECGVNTDSTIVTVSGAPRIDISPIPDSCFVETFVVTPTLSFDADCFSTPVYEWEFPGGSPNSHTGEFPPAITYDDPGNYTIRLIVENDCGETTVRERFELFPPPAVPNIMVTEEVCVGGVIEATNPFPPDPPSNRYFWTGPNGFTSSDATWTISPANTANAGTYTLTVTDANGCTVSKDFIVNVTLSAPIQINPDPATVCLGEDLVLTASGGVTYSWEGDHLDGDSGTSVVFNHDVVGDYEVIVVGSDPAGECDGTDTILVTVVPFPVVDGGAPRLGCVGADFNLQTGASPQITAGTTGSWSGEHITPEGVFNVDVPGEYTVTYTFSDGDGCSGSDEATICVRDQPEAVFTLPVNVGCVADGIILRPDNTSNTADDCSPATYLWTVSFNSGECNDGSGASSFIEGTDSGSLNPVIELTESGEYTLSLMVSNGCSSNTATETVTVGDRPSVSITEVTDKCGPQPINFTADISACNTDITTYSWDFPTADPPAASDAASPPPVPFSVGLHTITLAVTNACGTTMTTETFEVLEGPVINISLARDTVCAGDQVLITGNSTGSSLSFSWTSSDPGITFSNASSETPTITFGGVPVGRQTVTVTVGNDVCPPVTTIFDVFVSDRPDVSIVPLADGCGQATITPQVDYGLVDNLIDSVRWDVVRTMGANAGAVIYSGVPLNAGVDVLGAGTYTFTATAFNRCAPLGVSESVTFRLYESPVGNYATDTDFLCRGTGSVSLTSNFTGDIDTYEWRVTEVATNQVVPSLTSTEENPTFTFGDDLSLGDYIIAVSLGNAECGNIPWDTVVTLSAIPAGFTLGTIQDQCDNITFDPTPDYGEFTAEFVDSVRWTFPAGSTPTTSTELDPGPVSLNTTGTGLEVRLDVFNSCGSGSTTTSFDLLVGPILDVAVDTTFVCRGDAVTVINNSAGDNLVYTWTADPAAGVTFSDPNGRAPTVTFNGEAGTYTISAAIGNPVCGTLNWDTIIRVSEQPTVLIAEIPDYCDTALVSLSGVFSDEAFIDSVSWRLEDEDGTLLFSSTSFAPAAAPTGVGRYTVTATVFNECGRDDASREFQVFSGPLLDLRLDTNFVCLDDNSTVSIQNNSTGDSLSYNWTVTPTAQISDPGAPRPGFTFPDTGVYIIVAEVGNSVCDPVFWTDTVLVSEGPQLAIDAIGDFCGGANISPIGTSNNLARLDSLRWYFPGATDSTSTLSDPGQRMYSGPGTYTVSLVAWNSCGRDSVSTSFRVLEPIVVEASADTNFSCDLPFVVNVTNATAGDDLNYDWRIEGPFAANVLFDAGARNPVFTIQDTGTYVIVQRVFNETCGDQFWRDTVTVLAVPLPVLVDQTQFCEEASLTPAVDYGSYRLDSVVWRFPGSQLDPPTTNELFPTNIPYSGAGTYTYTVTAYNACGAQSVADTFIIDTIPEIILGPTDTICISEGLFEVPMAVPTGGEWRDSLGRPGVITEDGVFDPVVAGGGVSVVEYVFTVGACEIVTQKDIFVVDLADVAVVPDVLNACVTDTGFILDNGTPGPGWYTGPGVTDTLGVMDPSSLGEGAYVLTYHYQAPGTSCSETRNFTVNVRPLPAPAIGVTDSICVNVPVEITHAGSGAVAWDWRIGDGTVYGTENIVHPFLDTGFQTIQLISTSEFGCQDSTIQEIFVSGPPVARFTKDTTMGCALLPVNFDNESIGFQFVRYGWDFGNGERSTEFNPSTIFYDQGNVDTTYYINLVAINACGEDSYRDSVIVFPSPKAFLDVSQDEGCTPLYVEFLNITSGLPDRFEWFIDGALYSTDSIAPDRSFTAPDSMNVSYEVMLIAYNECGIDTARRTITVLPNNVRAFFSVEDQVGCEPFDVQFRNFSDPDTLVTFDWFFGDGSTSQLQNPLHTFRNTSDTTIVYEVTLIADNGCGQDSIMIPITVNPAPQVSFTAPPITCARDTVFFTNTSEDVTNPIWAFGDGETLTMIENPGHVFMQPGTYIVELTAFAIGTGCPNTWTETINIRPIPVAAAAAAPLFGCPPLEVSVNNFSIDADFYFWDYGDGNTSVGPEPLPHTYTQPGVYDITLTASDEFGCGHDSVVATVQVYEVPVVSFETEPERQCGVPMEICFENNSENGGDYRWDFGNGQTSNDNNPCVTYETAGDYVVSLVATNSFLCETRTETPISVYGVPVADFSIPDSTVCEIATVTFTNTSQEAEFTRWIFSDGFVSTDFNVTRTFTEVGIYGFTLIVGNGSGCADTLVTGDFLEVNPSPIADFAFTDRPDQLPTTIEFTDLSSSDAILFGWDFDDGTVSDEMNPVHRYLSSFDKTVVHWVENAFGCTDTIEMVVDLDTLGALFIPNIFTPNDASTPEKDIFKPKGIGLSDYYIAVYTRNGQIVWESDMVDEEGIPEEAWDGTFQGQPLPAGTYLWRVHRASFFNGRPWPGMADDRGELRRTGYVTLVR